MPEKKKKVLITGCSGFLASFLIDRLQESCELYDIFGFTEVPDFTSTKFKFFIQDIRDKDGIFTLVEKVKPDITFHLAAISNVGFSWKNQKLTYEINFIGSSNLLEALSTFVPKCKVLMMSSAELYGGSSGDLLSEMVPTYARNPYALSKKAMEMLSDIYIQSNKMDIIKLRSFNFTGPKQDKKFVASDFSYQIAEIEKGKKEPVIRVGNLSAIRDISDVRDIARYLEVIGQEGESSSIYNLCSGNTFTIQEILDTLLSFTKTKIKIVVDENKMRPIDVPKLAGDNSLIKEKFNLIPTYNISQTLADLLNYWREQE